VSPTVRSSPRSPHVGRGRSRASAGCVIAPSRSLMPPAALLVMTLVVMAACGRAVALDDPPVEGVVEGPAEGLVAEDIAVDAEPAVGPENGAVPEDPAAARAMQIQQQAAQYEAYFRRHLDVELALLRTLHADLPVEQRKRIRAAGQAAVADCARRLVESEWQQQVGQPGAAEDGGVLGGLVREGLRMVGDALGLPVEGARAPAPRRPLDPRADIVAAITTAVETELGADAARAYREENEAREKIWRAGVVQQVVIALDNELRLSARQREAIRAAIGEEWKDDLVLAEAHGHWSINGWNVFPGLDREKILPHLSEIQARRFCPQDAEERRKIDDMFQSNIDGLRRSAVINRAVRMEEAMPDPWWDE